MAIIRLFTRIKEKHPQLYRIEISKPNIYVLYKIYITYLFIKFHIFVL